MPHEQEGYAEEMNEHAQEELDTIQDQERESNSLRPHDSSQNIIIK